VEPTIPVRGGWGGTRFGGFCGSQPIPFFFCSGPRVFLEFFLGLGLYEPVHLVFSGSSTTDENWGRNSPCFNIK
jgi:hypothetical protein